MPRSPIAAEDALPEWLRRRWLAWPLGVGILLFLLTFAVVWVASSVYGAILFWHHHNDPTVAVFLAAWLLIWVGWPVAWSGHMLADRCEHPTHLPSLAWWMAGTIQTQRNGLVVACVAAAWFTCLAAALRQGNVHGFVVGSALTAAILLHVIAVIVYRQTVSIDIVTLEIRDTIGPLHRTRRYQLRLIRNPRAEREENSEGDHTAFWKVAFDYGPKTVRFGHELSGIEAEERAEQLAQLT
jgi:hypothetical protein